MGRVAGTQERAPPRPAARTVPWRDWLGCRGVPVSLEAGPGVAVGGPGLLAGLGSSWCRSRVGASEDTRSSTRLPKDSGEDRSVPKGRAKAPRDGPARRPVCPASWLARAGVVPRACPNGDWGWVWTGRRNGGLSRERPPGLGRPLHLYSNRPPTEGVACPPSTFPVDRPPGRSAVDTDLSGPTW